MNPLFNDSNSMKIYGVWTLGAFEPDLYSTHEKAQVAAVKALLDYCKTNALSDKLADYCDQLFCDEFVVENGECIVSIEEKDVS